MSSIKLTTFILLQVILEIFSFSVTGYATQKDNVVTDIPSYDNTIALSKENYKFDDLSNLEIETERLVITPTNEKDLNKLAEYLLDKQVSQYLDPTITDGFETQEQALKFLKSDGSDEYSKALEYTIKLKDSNIPIGKLDLMLSPNSLGKNSILSIGYWLGRDFQGKGYMSEACFKLFDKAFNASDVRSLYVACDVKNEKSSILADKIFDYIQKNSATKLFRNKCRDKDCCTFDGKEISFDYYSFILKK